MNFVWEETMVYKYTMANKFKSSFKVSELLSADVKAKQIETDKTNDIDRVSLKYKKSDS